MKKILIQYLYIIFIYSIMFLSYTSLTACETIKDETPPFCEKEQVSTKENPCKEDYVDINTLSEALNKLGETGTLPK